MTPQQIVDASQDQKKYPVLMKHPAHRKATISGYRREGNKAIDDPPGIPGQFEDHWCANLDQEKYYASMGYIKNGVADAETYRMNLIGAAPVPDHDYPKALYKLAAEGTLDSVVANDSAHHGALTKDGWVDSPQKAKDAGAKKIVKIAPEPKTETKAVVKVEAPKVDEPKPKKAKKTKKAKRVVSEETRDKMRASYKKRVAAGFKPFQSKG